MTKKFFAVFILICILVTTVSVTANADAPYREPGYINHYSAYYIRNAKSGLYLDLQASGTTNGTHFQQYTFGDPSEVFTLISVSTDVYAVKSTFYNAEGRSMVMDGRSNCVAGAQVILYPRVSEAPEQDWYFRRNDDGTYCISPKKHVYLNLAVEGSSTSNNAKVKLEARASSDNQKWYLEPVSAADFQPKYMFPDPENGVTPYRNVSSGYKTSERPTHYALDIIGKNADISYQNIYSPTSGTVVFSNYTGEAGYYVIIESDMCWRGTGKKIKYTFGHLAWKSELKVGQRILPWDFIGYVGDTGDPDPVYGPPGFHLHTAIFHVKNNARLWPDGDNCHNPQFFHSNTDFVGDLSSTSP